MWLDPHQASVSKPGDGTDEGGKKCGNGIKTPQLSAGKAGCVGSPVSGIRAYTRF